MINNILLYSAISFFILILVSKISYQLNLVELTNKRKIHRKPTAFTGGLALSIIYIFSILLFDVVGEKINSILPIAFLFGIVGFVDDKHDLKVNNKIILQICFIMFLITLKNFYLNHLGDYNYFKLELNSFAIPFTLISIMILINSANYFDGLDGTLGFLIISVIGILFFLTDEKNTRLFLITILIPVIIFLFFNFSKMKLPKLFLGNSGSLLLGFILAFTLIYIENNNEIHPILIAWSIAIFVYEFLSINVIRLKNKKKIFKANLDHLHHILFKKYKSLIIINSIIVITNVIFFIIGYLSFNFINPLASLILFILFFILFLAARIKILKKNNFYSLK